MALLTILLLLLTPLGMLIIRLWRPRFAFFWLIAAAAAFSAWLMTISLLNSLPLSITLVEWKPVELFPVTPALLVDAVSWPFALAVTTLVLAAILSDVAQASIATADAAGENPPDWWSWAAGLTLAGLGVLAVLADNLVTVLLALSAMDLVEIVIWLSQARNRKESEQVATAFSGRLAGIVGILWTGIMAQSTGLPLTFDTLNPQTGTTLILSAGLRLGVLPGNVALIQELARRRTMSSLVRLIPPAASLALLGRAAFGADPALAPYLLLVTGLAAVYGGLSWAAAKDELQGQGAWVLGMSALALASAVRAQPAAGLGWGLALLLPGGTLFLTSARKKWLLPFHILGALCLSALPFMPSWQGVRLYSAPFAPALVLFLIAHALLLAGYLRHALNQTGSAQGGERWVWAIYPVGLALPVLVNIGIAWWSRPGAAGSFQAQPLWFESWPGVVSAALAGAIILIGRRSRGAPLQRVERLQALVSLGWLYRLVWAAFYAVRRLVFLISRVLEGQAGILWALLVLTLLLSLLATSV